MKATELIEKLVEVFEDHVDNAYCELSGDDEREIIEKAKEYLKKKGK